MAPSCSRVGVGFLRFRPVVVGPSSVQSSKQISKGLIEARFKYSRAVGDHLLHWLIHDTLQYEYGTGIGVES